MYMNFKLSSNYNSPFPESSFYKKGENPPEYAEIP